MPAAALTATAQHFATVGQRPKGCGQWLAALRTVGAPTARCRAANIDSQLVWCCASMHLAMREQCVPPAACLRCEPLRNFARGLAKSLGAGLTCHCVAPAWIGGAGESPEFRLRPEKGGGRDGSRTDRKCIDNARHRAGVGPETAGPEVAPRAEFLTVVCWHGFA